MFLVEIVYLHRSQVLAKVESESSAILIAEGVSLVLSTTSLLVSRVREGVPQQVVTFRNGRRVG